MNWTQKQWDAMCHLRGISTPGRQATATTRALKMVLMEGKAVIEAAKSVGITRQALESSLDRTRETVEQARLLHDAPIPPSASEIREAIALERLKREKARIESELARIGK